MQATKCWKDKLDWEMMNLSCFVFFFFSNSHSFLRLLMEVEDTYLIWHILAVLCLIQEYENYLTYVHINLHYCEGFQLIWSVSLLGRADTGYRVCAWRILSRGKSGIIFFSVPCPWLIIFHIEVAGGATTWYYWLKFWSLN